MTLIAIMDIIFFCKITTKVELKYSSPVQGNLFFLLFIYVLFIFLLYVFCLFLLFSFVSLL